MKFKYSETWAEELLELAKNARTSQESKKLSSLVEMTRESDNIQVIQVLIKCLEFEMYGVEQTIYGILENVNYSLYYKSLFQITFELLISDPYSASKLLSMMNTHEYTKEEWEIIVALIHKYLKEEDIKGVIHSLEENIFFEEDFDYEDEDYPYPQFYKLFQKILKEKENNKSEM